jgi:signal transduction histidine kinase
MSENQETKLPTIKSGLQLCEKLISNYEADAVALVSVNPDSNLMHIYCGIAILESRQEINEADIESAILSSVLKRGRPLRLMDMERHPELEGWASHFNFQEISNLMLLPYAQIDPDDQANWAIVLLRQSGAWQYFEQTKLEQEISDGHYPLEEVLEEVEIPDPIAFDDQISIEKHNGSTLEFSQDQKILDEEKEEEPDWWEEASNPPLAKSDLDEDVISLQEENRKQHDEIFRLLEYIDQINLDAASYGSNPAKDAEHSKLIGELQRENESLRQELASADNINALDNSEESSSYTMLKEELRLALGELSTLYEELRIAETKPAIQEARKVTQHETENSSKKSDRLANIAQEMRQPLSSIMGYTDLLLGESVGILGAMQRNFLERVHTSTERMDLLVDDLIKVAELRKNNISTERSVVSLSEVIDPAIASLSQEMQKKNIALRVDMPKTLPPLQTDRDALQQIVYYLVQNAYRATPENQDILLQAMSSEQEEYGEYLLLQVQDSGGGIADEDVSRVFSRVYRAQNPEIAGVGDSGVGLTIAETLTKALGGRIWVESENNQGSTFSVLLPLNQE